MEPQVPQDGINNKEEVNAILKPLRTYEMDIAEMIRANQASAFSVNLAEKRRTDARAEEEARAKSEVVHGGIDPSQPIATPLSVVMPKTVPASILATKLPPIKMGGLAEKEADFIVPPRDDSGTLAQTFARATPTAPAAPTPAQAPAPKETPFYVLHENPIAPAPLSASRKEYFSLPKEHRSHSTLFTVLSIVFIFIGIGILSWLYFLKTKTPVVTTQPIVISTFLPSNQEKIFNINGLSILQTAQGMSAFLDNTYANDSVTQIKAETEIASTTSAGVVTSRAQEATADIFFESFAPHIPASLTRAFNKKMFAGIYTLDKNHAFFIVQIDSFDRAFEGMLAWEKNMYDDLMPFIHKKEKVAQAPATVANTSSTTPVTSVATEELVATPLANFEDVIVQNKDTRLLKNNQGETLMLYSFIDQKTLFIVDNEDTFKEVLKRYEASKLLR